MKLIFFFKMCKFYVAFENAIKFKKSFLVLKIITFELVTRITVNSEDKTCVRLSKF